MNEITLWKAVNGLGVTVELNGFVPAEGYELFLKDLCAAWEEQFIDWHNGVESGIGHITYSGERIGGFWTDFPMSLNFDCLNGEMAQGFYKKIRQYLENYSCNINSGKV